MVFKDTLSFMVLVVAIPNCSSVFNLGAPSDCERNAFLWHSREIAGNRGSVSEWLQGYEADAVQL